MRVFIGVDPGLSGGIAAVAASGVVVSVGPMPTTERDVLDRFAEFRPLLSGEPGAYAMLERVWSSPQQGVKSAFTFGRGYGGLRMALAASGIPFDEVLPSHWQKALGCMTKGDKNVSKRRAQDLFPGVKVTHAVADALLLAEYCRRVRLGGYSGLDLTVGPAVGTKLF